nr:MAG TPA: hypothetical protein [Bacteriophage sp.]
MERLTKRDTDGQAMMDCEKCKADWTGKHGKPMVDCTALYCRNRLKARLAAYEDTGLTPGEVKSMQEEHFSGLEMAKLHSALMELKKYQEADKDGRLVVLTCKVGDTVWAVSGKIIKCEIEETYLCDGGGIEFLVSFNCDGADCKRCPFNNWTQDCSGECYCDCEYGNGSFKDSDIGKTIFLTREEAESALEATKDGNG